MDPEHESWGFLFKKSDSYTETSRVCFNHEGIENGWNSVIWITSWSDVIKWWCSGLILKVFSIIINLWVLLIIKIIRVLRVLRDIYTCNVIKIYTTWRTMMGSIIMESQWGRVKGWMYVTPCDWLILIKSTKLKMYFGTHLYHKKFL